MLKGSLKKEANNKKGGSNTFLHNPTLAKAEFRKGLRVCYCHSCMRLPSPTEAIHRLPFRDQNNSTMFLKYVFVEDKKIHLFLSN